MRVTGCVRWLVAGEAGVVLAPSRTEYSWGLAVVTVIFRLFICCRSRLSVYPALLLHIVMAASVAAN